MKRDLSSLKRSASWRLTIAGAALLTVGCSGDRLATAPVTGTVYLDDKPLADALLTFMPERGQTANGVTAADGKFTLTTYREGDGAIPGRHLVMVSKHENPPPKKATTSTGNPLALPPPPGKSLIPEVYGDAATSGLQQEVMADQDNVIELRLSSKRR
jgi:hypothetical protein